MKKLVILFVIILLVCIRCKSGKNITSPVTSGNYELDSLDLDRIIATASSQISSLSQKAIAHQKIPRTIKNEDIHWAKEGWDWTSGFFPGTNWYLYEILGDEKWKTNAETLQSYFKNHRFIKHSHDLGFVFQCSYGNGLRLTNNKAYKNILIEASNTLLQRFDENVKALKSWDVNKGWQSKRGWQYPVIIDNMMNLEILLEASQITNDPRYRSVAIQHANTTLEHHFREDGSSFHVVDFAPEDGKVRSKCTAQGYDDNSTWARGQAWGLYGFITMYRYTGNRKYLEQSVKIADFIMSDDRIEEDKIPYWDYDAPNKPQALRDVSAACITASAMIELSEYADNRYLKYALDILHVLSSDKYMANTGSNENFILKHSVGSIPHNNELDVPLNYADYYFVEAISRLKKKVEIKK